MTKQINEYLTILEQFFLTEHSEGELLKARAELLRRIEFYQHERLIHLIVTMSFAVFFLMSVLIYFVTSNSAVLLLTGLLFIMLAAYIKHYYFLENSVQKMYTFYYKVEKM